MKLFKSQKMMGAYCKSECDSVVVFSPRFYVLRFSKLNCRRAGPSIKNGFVSSDFSVAESLGTWWHLVHVNDDRARLFSISRIFFPAIFHDWHCEKSREVPTVIGAPSIGEAFPCVLRDLLVYVTERSSKWCVWICKTKAKTNRSLI